MKFIFTILLVLLNLINVPLNFIYQRVKKWYLPMWKKDKIIYFAFAPFYIVLVVVSTIVGYPCEILGKKIH